MKHTKAFSLKAYDRPVEAITIKGTRYPVSPDDTEIFISGQGWKKIGKRKRIPIDLLPEAWTAADLKHAYDQYGYQVVLGLLYGWGNGSLFGDRSYGIRYHRAEIGIMCRLGKIYDDFTDAVHEVDLAWEAALSEKHNITFENGRNDSSYEKHVFRDGEYLLSGVDVYPSQYLETLIMGMVPCRPIFNPMEFESGILMRILIRLDLIDTYREEFPDDCSTKNKITYLTNSEIADKVESIMTLTKETFSD